MIEEAKAWRAVRTRDRGFDGRLIYAVQTTGIYCRPSCPARRPARAHVTFFETSAAAHAAGFRMCKRCKPDEAAGRRSDVVLVERASAFLAAAAAAPGSISLTRLADECDTTPSTLRRSFMSVLGISPKAYGDALRAGEFRRRLRRGESVSQAIIEAGFGSTSRVYERRRDVLGMRPSEFRRRGQDMVIRYTAVRTPIGYLAAAFRDGGVCALALASSEAEAESGIRAEFPKATLEAATATEREWVAGIVKTLSSERARGAGVALAEVPIDVAGTAFQRRVWQALRRIPRGETRTYKEVAAAIGLPKGARAVARACATNPASLVIPCHRVVRGDGGLGGYRWGLDRKRRLLELERD